LQRLREKELDGIDLEVYGARQEFIAATGAATGTVWGMADTFNPTRFIRMGYPKLLSDTSLVPNRVFALFPSMLQEINLLQEISFLPLRVAP
jgi:hypothetical protein